nr:MAG TPA: hypothetical protein [Caudoviricetes sp.]
MPQQSYSTIRKSGSVYAPHSRLARNPGVSVSHGPRRQTTFW